MEIIKGMIITNPYNYINNSGSISTHFKIQVDRGYYIYGTLNVNLVQKCYNNLKIGEKVLLKGKFNFEYAPTFYSTFYQISL